MNSADPAAVQQALMAVRQELDRRMAAGATDEPDLVVVIRELGDLDAAAIGMLKTIAAAGPRHRVRLVVASERPVAEVLQDCPFLDELGTRLVLQTRDEEESVALLGTPAGEELGSGGHALLRLESRVPIQGWARLVPGDYLARLLSLMGTRDPRATVTLEAQTEPVEDTDLAEELVAPGPGQSQLSRRRRRRSPHRLPLVWTPRRTGRLVAGLAYAAALASGADPGALLWCARGLVRRSPAVPRRSRTSSASGCPPDNRY